MTDMTTVPHRPAADAMRGLPRSTYDEAEWAVRIELAALYRVCALYGMSDLVNGAIGARIPESGHYLTHPYGMFWEEATASAFVTVDRAGAPVHGDTRWINDGAVNLCRWIFGTRHDIDWFVHGHEEPIAAVASIEGGLQWVNQPAVYLGHMMGTLDYEFDEDDEFGRRVCDRFADNNIVISHNHGHWTLGRTAGEAFFRAYFLRQACTVQLLAQSTGEGLRLIDPVKVATFQQQMYDSDHYNYDGATEWPGLLRKLDRENPGYDR